MKTIEILMFFSKYRNGRESGPSSPLSVRGGRGERINEVIHQVTGVTLDPRERHGSINIERECKEFFPKISVLHRLTLGIFPTTSQPADVPFVVKTFHHVVRITHDLDRTFGILT